MIKEVFQALRPSHMELETCAVLKRELETKKQSIIELMDPGNKKKIFIHDTTSLNPSQTKPHQQHAP